MITHGLCFRAICRPGSVHLLLYAFFAAVHLVICLLADLAEISLLPPGKML